LKLGIKGITSPEAISAELKDWLLQYPVVRLGDL